MSIAVVPGHRPGAPGAGKAGLYEYPVARTLAREITARTDAEVYTRPDHDGGLVGLVDQLNEEAVDATLSIHFNATKEGVESPDLGYCLHYPGSEGGTAMADVLTETVSLPGIPRVDPRSAADLALLRETIMPVVIDEVCYIDRADHQYTLLKNLETLADAYVEAVNRIDEETQI
jgi:N-acetylmuramoyl-L-alanine amidase